MRFPAALLLFAGAVSAPAALTEQAWSAERIMALGEG